MEITQPLVSSDQKSREQITSLESQIETLQLQIQGKDSNLSTLQQEISSLQEKLKNIKPCTDHEQQIQQLTTEIKNLASQLSAYKLENEKLAQAKITAESLCNQKDLEIQKQAERIQKLSQTVISTPLTSKPVVDPEIEKLKSEIKKLQQLNATLNQQDTERQKELEELKKKTSQPAPLSAPKSEELSLKIKIETLEKQLKASESKAIEREEKIAELTKKIEQLSNPKAEEEIPEPPVDDIPPPPPSPPPSNGKAIRTATKDTSPANPPSTPTVPKKEVKQTVAPVSLGDITGFKFKKIEKTEKPSKDDSSKQPVDFRKNLKKVESGVKTTEPPSATTPAKTTEVAKSTIPPANRSSTNLGNRPLPNPKQTNLTASVKSPDPAPQTPKNETFETTSSSQTDSTIPQTPAPSQHLQLRK